MANIPVEPRRRPTGLLIAAVLLAILAVVAVWYLTSERDQAATTETTPAPAQDDATDPVGDAVDAVGEAAESAGEAVQEAAGDAAEAVEETVNPDNGQ
jgi:hypothetical protein